jgi:xanthine dehydrogenase accessory factor
MLLDLRDELVAWRKTGTRFALATVVRTWKSAPRPAGAVMAVAENGKVIGSVSGGCVEGAVYGLAQEVLESGTPQLATFGVGDEDAFAVGLTCGGVLDVFIEPVDDRAYPMFDEVLARIGDEQSIAVATVVKPGPNSGRHILVDHRSADGSLGSDTDDEAARFAARAMLTKTAVDTIDGDTEVQGRPELSVFVQSYAPARRMIVFGAIDFAGAVSRIGKFLGYRVTVCDARPIFATPERFPLADEVVVDWPHRYLTSQEVDEETILCVLTHDPKFDIPLLKVALETPARYVGAMGSRRAHADRVARLREEGVPDHLISRLRSPIGLDLGGRTPEETAVSIAAEIITATSGCGAQPLSIVETPIHP